MNTRDQQIVKYINKHFRELQDEVSQMNGFDDFVKGGPLTKAVKMDILQIGECINNLTDEGKVQLNAKDLRGIADVRNHIAHGYITIDDQIIWEVILVRLPELIKQINNIK